MKRQLARAASRTLHVGMQGLAHTLVAGMRALDWLDHQTGGRR